MNVTTKLLLVAASCALGLCMGVAYSKSLKNKRLFYDDMLSFIDAIISDISFRQDGIISVATLAMQDETKSTKFKYVIKQYIAAPDCIPNLAFLPKSERGLSESFFSSLGKTDTFSQKAELQNIKSKFEEVRNKYAEKCEKQCAMAIKLGLLGGLALGILAL